MKLDKKEVVVEVYQDEMGLAVRATHAPSGLQAVCHHHKTLARNQREALHRLEALVEEWSSESYSVDLGSIDIDRK